MDYPDLDNAMEDRAFQKHLSEPHPVKLIAGLIIAQDFDLEALKKTLVECFGPIDLESLFYPFKHTGYYNKEMGPGLIRSFLSFLRPVLPDRLAEIKLTTNRIEMREGRSEGGRIFRLVNIDPGFLSLSNVILATTKNRAHRIYLSNGIYAEVTLIFSKRNGWQVLDWTYPDYRDPLALEFFRAVREKYYLQIKEMVSST
jgi:hypothetical protein